jgi:hypothetical protein
MRVKPAVSARKVVSALLSMVKVAIAQGQADASATREVPIAYDGQVFFFLTDRALRCAKCGRQLVPRNADDIRVWSWGKSQFIRDHVRCSLP